MYSVYILAVGFVLVALILAWRCPKEKIPELAQALSCWFRKKL